MARLRKALLAVALLLGLALAAGLVWRDAVAAGALRAGLAANGFGEAGFGEVEVGWGEAVVSDLSLGPGLPSARQVRLGYAPAELASGRLSALHIKGLRVEVAEDWRAALAPFGALTGGGGEGWLSIARVELADAAVAFAAAGGGRLTLDGALDLSGTQPGAALDVRLTLGGAEGRFSLRSAALGAGGVVEIDGAGSAGLAGLALPGSEGLRATAGEAAYTVSGTLALPAGDAARPVSWLAEASALEGTLELEGLTVVALPGRLAADIAWRVEGGADRLQLALARPATLELQDIAPLTFERLGIAAPPDRTLAARLSADGPLLVWTPGAEGGSAAIDGDLALALGKSRAELHAGATLRHDPAWRLSGPAELALRAVAAEVALAGPGWAARLSEANWTAMGTLGPGGEAVLAGPLAARLGNVATEELTAETLHLDGRARLGAGPGGWSLRFAPEASLVVEGAASPGRVRLAGPATLDFARLEARGGEGAVRLGLTAEPAPLSGVLLGGAGGEIAFAEAGGRVTLDLSLGAALEGELRLADGTARLPGEALRLDAVSASLTLAGRPAAGPLSLSAELGDTGRPARFAPLGIALEGTPDGERLALTGALELAGRGVRLPLTGTADPAALTGRLTAGPARLEFRPGGLQPGAISPALAALGEADGPVGVTGTLSLGPEGALDPRLSLDLDGLALRSGALEVTGLAGRLVLDRLAPPATAGPQELRARELIAGVPVARPRARFTVLPGRRGPVVQLHEGTAALAGGEVAITETRWDPAAESNAADVRVRGVDLARLLEEWQIEGLSGSGRLSGLLPVRIGPTGLAIAGGRLEASGPGVLRVDWGAARETLVGAGEQVALTVRALEDFRYERLEIGVERPADGALTLSVGLEGANPEVLDGYPFRFNISLSGRLEPILAALREGRRIGAGLIEGGLGR